MMKNLGKYAAMCIKNLKFIGIPVGNVAKWSETKDNNIWGFCHPLGGIPSRYWIEISTRLLTDNAPDSALYETIAHELLHTVPGCMNHGRKWQKYADLVNRTYGYDIKKISSCRDKGLSEHSDVPLGTWEVEVQFDHSWWWWDTYIVKAEDSYEAMMLAREEAEGDVLGVSVEVMDVIRK